MFQAVGDLTQSILVNKTSVAPSENKVSQWFHDTLIHQSKMRLQLSNFAKAILMLYSFNSSLPSATYMRQ